MAKEIFFTRVKDKERRKMEAYHSTVEDYITSIAQFGLIPNYGSNSESVKDRRRKLFFSSKEQSKFWKKRFNKDRSIILVFEADNEANYSFDNEEMYTTKPIPPGKIRVIVDDKEYPLIEYYNSNKEHFDELFENMLDKRIKTFLETENNLENILAGIDIYGLCLISKRQNEDVIRQIRDRIVENLKINNASSYLLTKFNGLSNVQSLEDFFELKINLACGYDFDPKFVNAISPKNALKSAIAGATKSQTMEVYDEYNKSKDKAKEETRNI